MFKFTKHAEEQLARRGLNKETILYIVNSPDQIINDEDDSSLKVFQSVVEENSGKYLYRIFVNTEKQPNEIVTLYKTSKISKYYENKI